MSDALTLMKNGSLLTQLFIFNNRETENWEIKEWARSRISILKAGNWKRE